MAAGCSVLKNTVKPVCLVLQREYLWGISDRDNAVGGMNLKPGTAQRKIAGKRRRRVEEVDQLAAQDVRDGLLREVYQEQELPDCVELSLIRP